MAVEIKHSFDMTRRSEYVMNPLDVYVDPLLDVRHEHKPVDDLVADMLSKPDGKTIKGQVVPITCRKNAKGFFTIICGRRRWEAICYINKNKLTPVPMAIRVIYIQADDIEALAMALSENFNRADMGPLDLAYSCKQFIRFGKDEAWIALNSGLFPNLANRVNGNEKHPELKKAIRQIKKWQALLTVGPAVEKALADGTVTESQAQHLAKLDKEHQSEALKKAERGELKPADIRVASDKPARLTTKQVKQELDDVISDGAIGDFKILKPMLDWLQNLRDRI